MPRGPWLYSLVLLSLLPLSLSLRHMPIKLRSPVLRQSSDANREGTGIEIQERSVFDKILLLARPGEGQLQNALMHKAGTTRAWSDPQMWTHMSFVVAAVFAASHQVYDLLLLLALVTPLSTAYHLSYEKPGFLAQCEGFLAKTLFAYGVLQLFSAPSAALLQAELLLLMATVVTFVGTNLLKRFYDPWHALMHVFPAVWALLVACNHAPLLRLPL
ncbi:hypothetical protein B484DRAFT_467720 [Ochromonadaceae sp. CCMP2298]|nr:hypothetical protein B484DRAFT_467720 [Ochromonadaceae sp. CCMP2298]